MIFVTAVVLLALSSQVQPFKFGGGGGSSQQSSASVTLGPQMPMAMPMPMLPPAPPQLPEVDTLYRAPLLLPTPAYYPTPLPARQPEYEQQSGVKGAPAVTERQPELPRPVLSLGPQTLAYVLVRPIQQHQYQYLEPLRYANRYQTHSRPLYRTEDKGIKGIQTETFEQQPQQFEEQRQEPTPYEPLQPIIEQVQAAAGQLAAKKTSKLAGIRSSLSKIAAKLPLPSTYQVVSEEYLLPEQQQQPIQQQPIQQQAIEVPQQQQLEQLPQQIEQQKTAELEVKGGEQHQERLPETEDLRQTKEPQQQATLDESLKTKQERVVKASPAAQAPVPQAEDKNQGF